VGHLPLDEISAKIEENLLGLLEERPAGIVRAHDGATT
jgi:hypothetical protein